MSTGFDCDDDGGGPEAAGGFADEAGVTDGGGIDRHVVSSGREHSANIFERSQSASDSEGDKDFAGGAGDDFAEAVAAIETGDSILIDQFVGSGFVVVASEGFGLLDVPPQRLNAKDTPVPYHPNLWAAHRPTARSIAAAARKLLRQ